MDCNSRRRLYHLEHGNFCAESERQRDSLRHAVYIRVLCHRAAVRPCDGRLLQDRFAYDRCNPGANGWRHANSHAYSQPDADTDANCISNAYIYSDAYTYSNANAYANGDTHGVTLSNRDNPDNRHDRARHNRHRQPLRRLRHHNHTALPFYAV